MEGANRIEESTESRVSMAHPEADLYPESPKGSRQKGLKGVGVCVPGNTLIFNSETEKMSIIILEI